MNWLKLNWLKLTEWEWGLLIMAVLVLAYGVSISLGKLEMWHLGLVLTALIVVALVLGYQKYQSAKSSKKEEADDSREAHAKKFQGHCESFIERFWRPGWLIIFVVVSVSSFTISALFNSGIPWLIYLAIGVFASFVLAVAHFHGGVRIGEKNLEGHKERFDKERRNFRTMQRWYNIFREEFLAADQQLKNLKRKKVNLELEKRDVQNLDLITNLAKRIDGLEETMGDSNSGKIQKRNEALERMTKFDNEVTDIFREGGWPLKVDDLGNLAVDELSAEQILELREQADLKEAKDLSEDKQGKCKILIESETAIKKVSQYLGKKVAGLRKCKEEVYRDEDILVKKHYIPFIACLNALVIFLLFLFASMADIELVINDSVAVDITKSVVEESWFYNEDWPFFGVFSRSLLFCSVLFVITYLLFSIIRIGKTERGVKFFLNRPFQVIGPGWRIALRGLVSIVRLPITVQYYNMERDEVMLQGKESQVVTVNGSIPYYFETPRDVITTLGIDTDGIIRQLQGKFWDSEDSKKRKERRGIIGDKVVASVRAFVAGRLDTLDEVLSMKDDLAAEIAKILKEDLGDLGLFFGNVVVTDVDPESGMKVKRQALAESIKGVEIAEQTASALIKEAEGEASKKERHAKADAFKTKQDGEAEAYKIEQKGDADAKALLAGMNAKIEGISSLKEKEDAESIRALLYATTLNPDLVSQLANAVSGMKFNVISVSPQFSEILSGVKQFLTSLGATTGHEGGGSHD